MTIVNRWWLLAGLGMALAACGPLIGDSVPEAESVPGLPAGPSALVDMTEPSFPAPLIEVREIVRVLPVDAIPAIDNPRFVTTGEADAYIGDREAIVAVEINGEAHGYPVGILTFHEIVNDTVGGVPVSVTYCPLCNSAVTFDRRVRGVETTFGVSGRLFNSALVMYDRATQSLWTHFDGRAVVGVLAGERVTPVGSPLMSWGDFKQAYPDGVVLDKDRTGFPGRARSYFTNPYAGYDQEGSRTLFPADGDGRLDDKERVVGFELGGEAVAWRLETLMGNSATVTHGEVAGDPVVIFWKPGQASALETGQTGEGRDVGSAGVFVPVVDGRGLTFTVADGVFRDTETGSTWNIAGRATSGELAGTELEQIPHLDTFWFAWSSFHPDSRLIDQ